MAISAYLTWPHASKWYQTSLYRRELKQWYAQAATWVEPATKLKYTENPEDAPNGKFARSYGWSGTTTYTGFRAFGGHPVERIPSFYAGGVPALAASPDQTHLFTHERTTPARFTQLIAVYNPRFDGSELHLNHNQIGLLNGECRTLRGGFKRIEMTGICGPGEIRIYAGQPDPNDTSRFCIPFEARGRRGWIDGVFENSDVEFTIRPEPATQPASTRPGA